MCEICAAETSGLRRKRCMAHRANKKSKEHHEEYTRNYNLMKKYGITSEDFDAYWIVFQGRCGICKIEMKWPEKRQGQSLDVVVVDHDHATGKVRGLLCSGCNRGLGFFKDSPEILQQAKRYLEL